MTGEGLHFVFEIMRKNRTFFTKSKISEKVVNQVQDDMVSPSNVQCVVLPQAVQDDMVSPSNVQCVVLPQAVQDDMVSPANAQCVVLPQAVQDDIL